MIENNQPEGAYLLIFGGVEIPFRIDFRDRKKLAISVHPDQRLEVVAPTGSATDQVLRRVEKRQGWILKQWRFFERFQPTHPGPRFVSGETVLYLGRQYRLKVHQDPDEMAKLVGKFLHIWTRDKEARDRIRFLLDDWYRQHAERLFAVRLQKWLDGSPSLRSDAPPKLTLRRMLNRWGSCTKAGNILLNPDLVKAPIHCVDYVIVHELCHRKIHNHSPAFYRLLSRCLPDWEQRKGRLESFTV